MDAKYRVGAIGFTDVLRSDRVMPALSLAFMGVAAERMGAIVLSALIAHTAWHWMTERGAGLGDYDFTADTTFARMIVRVAIVGVLVAAGAWILRTRRPAG